jgi:anti-sigma regulatory factor (Ser/Thr protein kinase)
VGRSRMLDQEFGETTLRALRETVLAHATAAGMPEGRALDVMLAVHELAANAVKHGGGTGHLQMSVTNGELICQVSDPGPARSGLPRSSTPGSQLPAPAARTSPWPYVPGHGLWLVRRVADHISVNSGLAGSQITVAFTMLRSRVP